jgi:hypothetical protein
MVLKRIETWGMISQDFQVDLACDYRIVADNTVIHKPSLAKGTATQTDGGNATSLFIICRRR